MANTQIKGLTVQIGGDATDLYETLKGMDKAAKKSSTELSDINRNLKLDPSNTVLLTQKQEVLAKSIGTAKEKLDLLKKAEAEAAEQVKKGDIGQEQYRALQREVVYAENKLKKLEKQLDDTKSAAQDTGKAVEKTGDQSKEAGKDAEALAKKVEKLKSAYKDAKKEAKDAGKELGATFAAGGAAVVAATAEAMSYEDALNSIQIQTGAADEEMQRYKKAMDEVYAGGYGEDLQAIASNMALIAQQTKETDPTKLQELTENAALVKESFGFETAEQLRAVKMLMDQFGISSKEAYDLIIAGAQNGLNKNGDLLDVINEYSVHYKNLGYDAKGFFNSLLNGAASGVFSVDKLGDAMKEFGIRIKDNGTATVEALGKLGYASDAVQALQADFAAGGEKAAEATQEVLNKLFSMSDAVAQNELGVALFGTMWEDLGKEAILALTDTSDALGDVEGAMEKVREIRMESTSMQWQQLGRTVQTELILPLGEKALPVAKQLFQYCIDNSDTLIPKLKALGVMVGTVFAVNKASKFIKSIKDLVTAYKALKTATQAANAAQSASLWGAIAMAIGLAVGWVVNFVQAQKDSAAAALENREALLELAAANRDTYRELADAEKEAARLRRDTAKAVNDEYDTYGKLWDELQDLVDAEGNVLKGNEDRVEYIRGELSKAIGEEIELVDGQIRKYKELSDRMDETLLKQRASRMIERLEMGYMESKEGLQEKQMAYEEANATWEQYKLDKQEYDRLTAARESLNTEIERIDKASDMSQQEKLTMMQPLIDEYVTLSAQRRQLEPDVLKNAHAEEARQEALRTYDEARTSIAQFEALEAAYYSGDSEQLKRAVYGAENGYMTADSATSESLIGQYRDTVEELNRLRSQAQNEGSTITDDQLAAAAEAVAITFQNAYGVPPANRHPSPVFWQENTAAILGSLTSLFSGLPTAGGREYLRVEDESAKGSYALLQRIADRLDQLDLTMVLDDGTLVGRTARKTDHALGSIIAQDRRGTLKE